jgi:hypothetical protein
VKEIEGLGFKAMLKPLLVPLQQSTSITKLTISKVRSTAISGDARLESSGGPSASHRPSFAPLPYLQCAVGPPNRLGDGSDIGRVAHVDGQLGEPATGALNGSLLCVSQIRSRLFCDPLNTISTTK